MIFTTANTDQDLIEILELQQRNLPKNLNAVEMEEEGFLSIEHDFDLLKLMNAPYPHIIAKAEGRVVGFTLVMLPTLKNAIPLIVPMFNLIEQLDYKGVPLREKDYFVMGQVCVDKSYRGQGVFSGLYAEMKAQMSKSSTKDPTGFDYIITDIAKENRRSIRAHEKVGFETFYEYSSDGKDWVMVLLEL